jgi:choline dehydrogenase-like flavoprotein
MVYEDVLPLFPEGRGERPVLQRYHGVDGPLAVSDPVSPLRITGAFIKAAQGAGYPITPTSMAPSRRGSDIIRRRRAMGGGAAPPCPIFVPRAIEKTWRL